MEARATRGHLHLVEIVARLRIAPIAFECRDAVSGGERALRRVVIGLCLAVGIAGLRLAAHALSRLAIVRPV